MELDSSNSLTLSQDVYCAIQGEGNLVGIPMTHIHLQGCDVGCNYCDVMSSWSPHNQELLKPNIKTYSKQYAFTDLYKRITDLGSSYWWFTGGEPTLQAESIIHFIDYADKWIHPYYCICTAGRIYDEELFSAMSAITVDVKAPSSGAISIKQVVDKIYDEYIDTLEFKMVVGNNQNDKDYAITMIERYPNAEWTLQPTYASEQELHDYPELKSSSMGWVQEDFFNWVTDNCKKYGYVRAGLQLHKHIYKNGVNRG